MTDEGRRCHTCDKPLTNSGRRSASGLYWCRSNRCQAAKAKYNYDLNNAGRDLGQAPTVCSGCGCKMTPRKMRVTDSPLGRWCHKPACRIKRRGTLELGSSIDMTEVLSIKEIGLTLARALVWGRVECPQCGRTDALHGYMHRDNDGARCDGVGTLSLKLPAAQALWPNEVGIPEGCGREEYDMLAPKEA